jgi:peptidoglycan/LPS O-acetylase OafA/YrhL
VKPLSHDEYLALKRFPALDGLRAVSALMVVFFHNVDAGWLQGWIGVQIFFVLSGFLITTLMLREHDRDGRVSMRNFYLRRFFRILPVYFLVLAISLVVLLIGGRFTTTGPGNELPLYLTFFNEFGHGGIYGQSWSLGIEQKFYLLWPVLAFSTVLLGRKALFGKRLVLSLTLMTLSLVAVPFTVDQDPRGWPSHYFSVLIGCLLAVLMHNKRGYTLVKPLTRPWVATVVALAFVGVHLSVQWASTYLDMPHHRILGTIPGFVAICPPYVVAVALLLPALLSSAPPQWLLTRKPMVFIGERSYSVYLMQALAAGVVEPLMPHESWLRAIPVAAIALLMAHVSYRWVEQPMINLGRRVIARRKEVRRPLLAVAGNADSAL